MDGRVSRRSPRFPSSSGTSRFVARSSGGAEFYLKRRLRDEGTVRYPPWYRIPYPNHSFYDLLVGLRILARLGNGADRRLWPALRWLRSQRNRDGTWSLGASPPDLEAKLAGSQYGEILFPMRLGPLDEPRRWATVEALSVLAQVERAGRPLTSTG